MAEGDSVEATLAAIPSGVDGSQIDERLRLTPTERLERMRRSLEGIEGARGHQGDRLPVAWPGTARRTGGGDPS